MVDTPGRATRRRRVAGPFPLSNAHRRLCDHGCLGHAHRRRGVRHGGGDRFGGLQRQGTSMVGRDLSSRRVDLRTKGQVQVLSPLGRCCRNHRPPPNYRPSPSRGNFLVPSGKRPAAVLWVVLPDRRGFDGGNHCRVRQIGFACHENRSGSGIWDTSATSTPPSREFGPFLWDRGVVC